MSTSNAASRARLEGLAIVAVALWYLWEARQIPDLFQMPGVPGPTAFPTLVGVVFGAAGLWRVLASFAPRAAAARGPAAGEGAAEGAGEGGAPAATGGWFAAHGRFYAMWAILLGYMAAMPSVGFPLATAVALALLFALLGERRWLVAAGLALAATVVLYLGFARGLGVQLPPGVLGPLFK